MGFRFFRHFGRSFFLFILIAITGLSLGCAGTDLEVGLLENPSITPAPIESFPSISQPNAASPSSIPSGQPTQASQGIAHPTSSASDQEQPPRSGAQEPNVGPIDPQNPEENSQDADVN